MKKLDKISIFVLLTSLATLLLCYVNYNETEKTISNYKYRIEKIRRDIESKHTKFKTELEPSFDGVPHIKSMKSVSDYDAINKELSEHEEYGNLISARLSLYHKTNLIELFSYIVLGFTILSSVYLLYRIIKNFILSENTTKSQRIGFLILIVAIGLYITCFMLYPYSRRYSRIMDIHKDYGKLFWLSTLCLILAIGFLSNYIPKISNWIKSGNSKTNK